MILPICGNCIPVAMHWYSLDHSLLNLNTMTALIKFSKSGFFICSLLFSVAATAQGNSWRGSVDSRSSEWVSTTYFEKGTVISISAGGRVCCDIDADWDHKCRTADTDHSEGALLIQIPGYSTFKYHEGLNFNTPVSGRIMFLVQDTKRSDNSGYYSVTVTYWYL